VLLIVVLDIILLDKFVNLVIRHVLPVLMVILVILVSHLLTLILQLRPVIRLVNLVLSPSKTLILVNLVILHVLPVMDLMRITVSLVLVT